MTTAFETLRSLRETLIKRIEEHRAGETIETWAYCQGMISEDQTLLSFVEGDMVDLMMQHIEIARRESRISTEEADRLTEEIKSGRIFDTLDQERR